MTNKEMTRNEHYVPKMYLNNFADTRYNKKEKRSVWRFDLKSMKPTRSPVLTDDICFEKDLYEFRGEDGSFLYQNTVEKNLSRLEGIFSNTIKGVISKARNKENYYTRCFLSRKEKDSLTLFMILLVLRSPETLSEAEEIVPKFVTTDLKSNEARNTAVRECLRSFLEPVGENEPNILQKIAYWFSDMAYVVGYSENGGIVTCDRVPFLYHSKKDVVDYSEIQPEKIIFPLSHDVVLYMCPKDKAENSRRNRLIRLNEEDIKEVCWSMASCAGTQVISANPFTDSQIKLIEAARERK